MLTSDRNWRTKNALKRFSKLLKDNMQDQTISKYYTDDNKSKYS